MRQRPLARLHARPVGRTVRGARRAAVPHLRARTRARAHTLSTRSLLAQRFGPLQSLSFNDAAASALVEYPSVGDAVHANNALQGQVVGGVELKVAFETASAAPGPPGRGPSAPPPVVTTGGTSSVGRPASELCAVHVRARALHGRWRRSAWCLRAWTEQSREAEAQPRLHPHHPRRALHPSAPVACCRVVLLLLLSHQDARCTPPSSVSSSSSTAKATATSTPRQQLPSPPQPPPAPAPLPSPHQHPSLAPAS